METRSREEERQGIIELVRGESSESEWRRVEKW